MASAGANPDGKMAVPPSGGRLSDVAYQRILEGLFDRTVPAGAFVSQNELVRLLGIPVAPLRDALRVLEAEGVLTIHPRSGIQFIKPGLELTRSTYQFRAIVERAAVRAYAENADEAEVEGLLERHLALIAAVERSALTPEHLMEMEDLEHLLHNSVIGILNNPLIESAYRRMHNYLKLLRLDRRLTSPVAVRTLGEHVAILRACRARNADHAEIALNAHFAAALQRSLGFL